MFTYCWSLLAEIWCSDFSVCTWKKKRGLAENSLPDRSFECATCFGDRDSRARDDRKDSRRPFEIFWSLILESCVRVWCTNIGLGAGSWKVGTSHLLVLPHLTFWTFWLYFGGHVHTRRDDRSRSGSQAGWGVLSRIMQCDSFKAFGKPVFGLWLECFKIVGKEPWKMPGM